MSLVLFSVFLSSAALGLLILVAVRFGNRATSITSALGVVASTLFFAPPVFFQLLLTFLLSLGCLAFRTKPRAVIACSFVAVGLSYGLFSLRIYYDLDERAQIRRQFPMESLEDRLAYEVSHTEARSGSLKLSEDAEKRLNEFESEREFGTMREYALGSVHSEASSQFVLAQGFGVSRMPRVSHARVVLPESEPIRLPLPPRPSEPYYPDRDNSRPVTAAVASPAKMELARLHLGGEEDFLDKERLGYVEDRKHVAGFVSHQFRKMPEIGDSVEWQVIRLQLVSLLRHKEPMAYVSEHLPNMEELKGVPVRPLDGFERSALQRLQSDEDLVIEDGTNRIRMLGSLRAAKDCLECHTVERGELLGAFSYDIMRMQRVAEPTPEEAF